MDIDKFIDSIENELFNRIRNSKSDAEARRLLKEHQSLQLPQPDVSDSLPSKTQLKLIDDDFVPCYVTKCCGVGPIVNEKFCPTCGKEIQRQ